MESFKLALQGALVVLEYFALQQCPRDPTVLYGVQMCSKQCAKLGKQLNNFSYREGGY